MGQSSQNTATTQQSSTSPGALGMPTVNGILGQLNPLIANSGLNPAQSGAINTLTQNAANGNPYAAPIATNATNLLNGGGAQNQNGAINSAYQNYYNQTNPMASNMNYDPTQSPGMQQVLQTIQGDTTNAVNGQFAAAGRDMSGMNQQTLARGLAQGEAAPLLAQYNQNVSNQQNAAGNLYNAGNTTSGLLNGTQAAANANTQTGTQAASDAITAQNQPAMATLAAQGLAQSIPAQNLGLLAQIGIPIAGMSTNSTGSGTSNTTMNPSLLSQLTSVGGLFSTPGSAAGGGTSAITGMGQAAAGLGSGLASGANGLLSFLSDRRLKKDICQVGCMFDGTPIYRYRYIGQPGYQIGLMAQDVERYAPDAVTEINGYKAVEYKAATERAVEAGGC